MDFSFLFARRIRYLVFNIVKRLLILFFLTSIIGVFVYRYVPVYITPLMVIRYFEQCGDEKGTNFEKTWKSIEKISPEMDVAALSAEDAKFMTHNGFDWESIGEAYEHNKTSDKVVGGSTISQQTAKNVFLWPGRSWLRKIMESYFTVLIEKCWSKKRILEVYLNIVETGRGVYGVEAAAQKFYKKPARKLNKTEAATIAASFRSPLKSDIAHPDNKMIRYRNGIVKNMKYIDKITFDN